MAARCARVLVTISGSIALIGTLPAQPAPRPEFEVASVKPGDLNPQFIDSAVQPGGRYKAMNLTLKELIEEAYDVAGYHIQGGPSWLDSDRFVIEARAALTDGATPPIKLMLQSLLESRFALHVHTEAREERVYELVIAKSGAKITPGDPAKPARLNGRGPITAASVPMSLFTRILSLQLHRTVVDKTGLTGGYDFVLSYTPDPGEEQLLRVQPDADVPSLFTALETQLGLRLVTARGPAEVLVIDRVERPQPN